MDPEEQKRLNIQRLRNCLKDAGGGSEAWKATWENNLDIWDAGQCQPALLDFIEKVNNAESTPEWSPPKHGNALIAGCGRGYDALLFAQRGLNATGIDISPIAVSEANKWLDSQAHVSDEVRARIHFKEDDFFNMDAGAGYDFAYDYTFFCAMEPSWRKSWGKRYGEVIKSDGLLLCVMWPLDGDREGGPAYSVSEEAYFEALSPYFTRLYEEVPKQCAAGHENREKVSVWKRK